jgi:NADH:ubiquinone oxidoreductase subunit H
MILIIKIIFYLLVLLINISFLTILEQIIISLTQNRLGPNKTSFIGFLQAIFDGIKLLKKEKIFLIKNNYLIYFIIFLVFYLSLIF